MPSSIASTSLSIRAKQVNRFEYAGAGQAGLTSGRPCLGYSQLYRQWLNAFSTVMPRVVDVI
jgi:hypothetical protein